MALIIRPFEPPEPGPGCDVGYILPSGIRVYPGDPQYAGIATAYANGAPFETFAICCTIQPVYAPF